MTSERWEQIQTIYHAVLEREPNQRSVFLEQACAGDADLRQEVESLLAHEQAESLISVPALNVAAQALAEDQGRRLIGKQIGSYKVLSLLGRGGMGEVYLAEDSRLARKVAVKLLPAQFSQDQDRVLRFKREARAASALNHPNILTVYEIGELDGHTFMVTEVVEGETLRERLRRGPVKLKELLDVTIQVASALSAAHEAGIVHRDIKPENIMLRSDGYVKVLDFGLAKRTELPSAIVPTGTGVETALRTESGIVMGTAPYMSPEQVLGEKVDQRSDVFSLGVVMFEVATGKQPFQANSSNAILDAILHKVPASPRRFSPELPAELERIITKALDKDRELRFQTVSDLRTDLKRLKRDTDSGQPATAVAPPSPIPGSERRWGRWATLIAIAILAVAIFTYYLTPPLPSPKVLSYVPITSDGLQKIYYSSSYPHVLVTDGSRLYFHPDERPTTLAQVSVTGGETALIPTPFQDFYICDISPNRSELLVFGHSGDSTEQPLWVLPLLGGSARRLGDLLAHAGTWSPDAQKILYANGHDLYAVKSDGTESHKLVTLGGPADWVRWSPDGRKLRFSVSDSKNLTTSSLWEIAPDGTNLHPLLPGWNNPAVECCGNWTPDGRYFVFQSQREGMTNIWAILEQPGLFREPNPVPVQLTRGPISASAPVPSIDGKKLFIVGAQLRGELARYDVKSGHFVPYLSGISAEHLSFSRDGEWVVYVDYPGANLWRCRVDGSNRLQLSFAPMQATLPRWSPDGKRILFIGLAPGKIWKMYTVSAEGGTPEQLLPGERPEVDPDWSPDGSSVVFGRHPFLEAGAFGAVAINLLDLKTRQVSTLPGSEGVFGPVWSPDGRYIAAVGEAAQKLLLFDVATQRWMELANIYLDFFSWARDGKHIYFDSPLGIDPTIFRVGVGDRQIERVVSLKNINRVFGIWQQWFGLAPDDSPLVLRSAGTQEIYALDWEAP